MSKHTPGPWKVGSLSGCGLQYPEEPGKDTVCVSIFGNTETERHGPGIVCDVGGKRDTIMNDACLIAASPELLETLKRVEYQLRIGNHISKDDDFYKIVVHAIAKAEVGAK